MSSNLADQNAPENELINRLIGVEKALQELRSNQLSILNIPVYTSDPTTPTNNQIWINDTSHTLKIRVNGVTKTVTLT